MSEVKISAKRLKELERAESKLSALEAGGVDNWEWYSESLSGWFRENRLEELVEEFIQNVNEIMVDGVDYDFPAGREAGISLNLNEHGEDYLGKLFVKLAKEYAEITED